MDKPSLTSIIANNTEAAVKPAAETAAELTKNITAPVSNSIGQTLSDVWYLVFGGITQMAEKRRIKYGIALQAYKTELEETLQDIPDDKRIEPNTQISMNALEDSRNCVEEPVLRQMFCKLLSSASNSEKASKAHPSFSSIIRRMSPFDALLLSELSQSGANNCPVVKFDLELIDGSGSVTQAKNVIALNGVVKESIPEVSSSIDMLQSLGLVSVDHLRHLTDDCLYTPFEACAYYVELSAEVARNYSDKYRVIIKRGCLDITDLGRRFIQCCL